MAAVARTAQARFVALARSSEPWCTTRSLTLALAMHRDEIEARFETRITTSKASRGESPTELAKAKRADLRGFEEEAKITQRSPRHMKAINLAETLTGFAEHWQPRVVGQFNGHDLMVVKVKGEFVWHSHDDTDDFFLVLKGRLKIRLHEGDVNLGPGEVFVVPRGVEHCPVAEEEAHILLIEPTGTPNTGNPATAASRRVI